MIRRTHAKPYDLETLVQNRKGAKAQRNQKHAKCFVLTRSMNDLNQLTFCFSFASLRLCGSN